jgi:hypothetical protein
MQPRPTAAEILAAIVPVLENEVVPALSGPAQHHARVAASLAAIVERELQLAAASNAEELERLASLLPGDASDPTDLRAVRQELATALRAGLADDPATDARVWAVLMDATRADLAVCKPGHDRWEGE